MYNLINIIIPVYNEGENIKKTLDEIKEKIRNNHKIYIVYDFDEDNTLPPVQEYIKKNSTEVSFVKNKYGRGVLNAIKTGFETAEDEVVLVVMADLSDNLSVVDEMFKLINQGYHVICGSRYMKGGMQIGGPKLKKLFSRLAGVSLYYLVGLPTHDVTNSFKMYTKKLLNEITIESDGGFELGMEIVVKAFVKGYKVGEVPSVWTDRTMGESRFKLWKWLPKYLKWYLFAFEHRYLKFSGKASV